MSVQIHPTLLAATCYWCWLLFDEAGSIEFKRLGPFKWIKHHPTLLDHHVECIQMGPAILCPPAKNNNNHHHHHQLASLLSTMYAMKQGYICVSFLF